MPKKIDHGAQRALITTAALSVIADGGLEAARLRDVASAAQVTTGAVMHYFPHKDAVIEAALEAIVARTLARMAVPLKPGAPQTPAAFIRRVARYLPLDEAGRSEWRVWLAFWGRAMAEPRLRAIHTRYYAALIAALVPHLAALGPHEPCGLDTLADTVIAALDGIGTRATLESEGWPPARQQAALAALLRPLLTHAFPGANHDPQPEP